MPSRRSRAPLSALPSTSYSAKIRAFSAADHRLLRAFAGTSGSGTGVSELTRDELQTRPQDNISGASPASLNLGTEGRGGDEGDVVVPALPGAACVVVQAEAGLDFAVVVLDAPAQFRPPG